MASPLQLHPHPGPWPEAALATLQQPGELGLYGQAPWLRNLADHVAFAAGEHPALLCLPPAKGPAQPVWPVLHRPQQQALRCLANYYSPLAGPVAPEGTPAAAWADFFAALREPGPARAATLELGPLPGHPLQADSTAGRLCTALRAAGYRVYPRVAFANWHLPAPPPWPDYWAQRPSRLRHTVARKGRQFAAAGGRLEVISQPADAERGLQAFERVYADSWKQREPHPQFIPGLVRLAARKGWLRLGVAWLHGEPVAAQLWLHAHGKTDIHKLAYRESHAKWGAGSLLTAHLMQHALEIDRATEVDYLTGDDAYKAEWMSHRRERWFVMAADPARLRGAWRVLRENLARTRAPAPVHRQGAR